MLRILGASRRLLAWGRLAPRGRARPITGWPQLGSEVDARGGDGGRRRAAARPERGAALRSRSLRRGRGALRHRASPRRRCREDAISTCDVSRCEKPTRPCPDGSDPIEIIVDAARWAPSGGNIQPWRFEADAHEIRMYLVPERTTTMDVRHRGSYVAIGAALFNARVAAASLKNLGRLPAVPRGITLAPRGDPAWSARRPTTRSPRLEPRVRTTGRQPPDGRHVAHRRRDPRSCSRGRVKREGVAAPPPVRPGSDRRAWPCCWVSPTGFASCCPGCTTKWSGSCAFPGVDTLEEGLDVRSLELSPPELAALDLLRRDDVVSHLGEWRAGQGLGARTRIAVGSSSALAVVTVPRPEPAWYVRGGSAVERLWLTAELHGLAVQPVSPVFLYAADEKDFLSPGGRAPRRRRHRPLEALRRLLGTGRRRAGGTAAPTEPCATAIGPQRPTAPQTIS